MKETTILSEIKELLVENFGDNIEEVILFGSRAQGNSRPDSDYDILVILKHPYDCHLKRKISDVCYQVDLKHDVFTDVEIISRDELQNGLRGSHPVFLKAIQTGIHA